MTDQPKPAHIKRIGQKDPENLLCEALSPLYGQRFSEYRRSYLASLLPAAMESVPDFPLTVLMELLNKCNLDCIMCYSQHRTGPKTIVALETIENLLGQCRENALPALMFGAGEEPLMYKDFDHVLAMAKDSGVMDTFVFTNGTLLDERRCNAILDANVTRVMVSIDAATPATYDVIRRRNTSIAPTGTNRLADVEANVRRLISLRNDRQSQLPMVRVSFAVQAANQHEVELFRERWIGVADYVEFQACSDYSPIAELGGFDETTRWASQPSSPGAEQLFCPQPWNVMTVWFDGSVSPCCSFSGKNLIIGNVHHHSLKEIWHGEKMTALREQFRCGELNRVCRQCLAGRDQKAFESV